MMHLDTSSDLLLTSVLMSALMVCKVSIEERSHLLDILLYGLALVMTIYFILWSRSLFLRP